MSTTLSFSFQHRALVPFAHDYAHGDSEPMHCHDCAQLLHILSGVVRVETPVGFWVVPPGRGVWLPAHTPHALRITGNVAARTIYRSAGPCRSALYLPDRADLTAAA
jgi:mannose-6-phosphate isomerase-like protein (cupin superfamily)